MIGFTMGIFTILIIMGVITLMIDDWEIKGWALWYVPIAILIMAGAFALAPAYL